MKQQSKGKWKFKNKDTNKELLGKYLKMKTGTFSPHFPRGQVVCIMENSHPHPERRNPGIKTSYVMRFFLSHLRVFSGQ